MFKFFFLFLCMSKFPTVNIKFRSKYIIYLLILFLCASYNFSFFLCMLKIQWQSTSTVNFNSQLQVQNLDLHCILMAPKAKDPAWAHADVVEGEMYCKKLIKGGGIFRLKQHLASIKGQVKACEAPLDVQTY